MLTNQQTGTLQSSTFKIMTSRFFKGIIL